MIGISGNASGIRTVPIFEPRYIDAPRPFHIADEIERLRKLLAGIAKNDVRVGREFTAVFFLGNYILDYTRSDLRT